ncbi:MAG TPA: GIY-YIG nuclease family protein [Microvirga sp.]|jgi:putative endonuclease|nr:GIY-YIG nuclease family protein [Microvirga sp.]
MPGCWLYILRCADGSYYVGTSRAEDLDTRVSQHQQGTFGGYTAKRRPVTLVYSSHFDRIDEAIASERQIKGWARAKKEALIRGDFEALPGLSRRGPKQARGASALPNLRPENSDSDGALPPTSSS